MATIIKLARPLPGSLQHEQKVRRMGEECEIIRDQTDSAGHHITFVRFPDGERRVLVDKDIATETDSNISHEIARDNLSDCVPTFDCMSMYDYDLGGEAG